MEVVPREEAFLGGIKKAIKKVSKAVKNVAKSPVGKAAMLYFAPMAFGQSAGLAGYKGLFNKVSPAFSNLIKAKGTGVDKAIGALKVGAATSAITGLLAAAEQGDEDAIEATTNVESLKKYLYSSYENLGYNPQEIPALVERDVSEYTSGAGGYATGGRVKYQQGSGIGTLQGGSQTTPETGKASYAQGPQLYKDLIDYLQIKEPAPAPEMISPEMMMDDMGGAMPAYGGSGSSGGITGSSITSGSTGGGSGTGILQATPGTTQPTTTPPSNVAPTTPGADPLLQEEFENLYRLQKEHLAELNKGGTYGPYVKELYRKGSLQRANLSDEELYQSYLKDYEKGDLGLYIPTFDEYIKDIGYDKYKTYDDYLQTTGGGFQMERDIAQNLGKIDPVSLEIYKKYKERRGYNIGGRIGYAEGTKENLIIPKKPKFQTEEEVNATTLGRAEIDDPMPERLESAKRLKGVMQLYDRLKKMAQSGEMSNKEEAMALFNKRMREESENLHFLDKEKLQDYIRKNRAYGGRMEYAMGSPEDNARKAAGIMDLPLNENKAGVTELDLRETGGFIPPVGVKEKADDIPAMLSNNEFVFTADAVRGMGNGDVNVGAQRMYDMMKKLENGGRV